MRPLAWISGAALIGGVAVGVAYTMRGPSTASPVGEPPAVNASARMASSPATTPVASPVAAPPAAVPGVAEGVDGRYEVTYTVGLHASSRSGALPGGGAAPTTAETRLDAHVAVARVRRDEQTWLVGRVTAGRFHGAQVAPELAGRPIEGLLAIRVADDGQLGEVRFDPSVPEAVRGTLQAVLLSAQLVRTSDPSAATWETRESGANTPYQATYRRAGSRIEKTWATLAPTADDPASMAYTESGTATFTVAAHGAAIGPVTAIAASQKGAIDLQDGAGGKVAFEASIGWQRVGDADVATADLRGLDRLEVFDRDQLVAANGSSPDSGRALSATEVHAALTKAGEDGAAGRWQDRRAAGSALAEAIKADDATASQVAAYVGTAKDEPTRRTALEALAAAGTPVAQSALVGLTADRSLDAATRTQAFGAATFVRRPTESLIEGLEASAYAHESEAMPSAAAIALAAAVRWDLDSRGLTTSGASGRFATEARRRLDSTWGRGAAPTAPEPTGNGPTGGEPSGGATGETEAEPHEAIPVSRLERREWTRALGNVALPELEPVLLALLNDPDEYVRAAAVFSSRFYPPGPLVAALAGVVASDDSIIVREAVAGACQFLGPGPCETLVRKAIVFDKSEHVRQSFAYTVGTWLHDAPTMSAILTEALAVEKSPKVSETLQNYLYPGRVAYPFRQVGGPSAGGQTP